MRTLETTKKSSFLEIRSQMSKLLEKKPVLSE